MDRRVVVELTAATGEQSRARYPDADGYVERDGVRVFYEVYGAGEPTILLLPTWSIIHSRQWKAQIPYLARHHRVVAFDGRGNGTCVSGVPILALFDEHGEPVGELAAGTEATPQSRRLPSMSKPAGRSRIPGGSSVPPPKPRSSVW